MCTDAYREALTRDLSSTASSASAPRAALSQVRAPEAAREGVGEGELLIGDGVTQGIVRIGNTGCPLR
jgi:hypothetical protein